MDFKAFAVLFVTLLAVNASYQNPLKDDSKDSIVSVLNNLIQGATTIINLVNDLIDDYESNEDEIANSIQASVTDLVQTINNYIVEGIDELKEGATDDGKAVLECVDAQKEPTNLALADTVERLVAVLKQENPLILEQLRTITAQLLDLQTDLQGQVDTLDACTGDDCYSALLTSLIVTVSKTVTVVQEDLESAVALLEAIKDDIVAAKILESLKENAQQIFNDGVVCIKS